MGLYVLLTGTVCVLAFVSLLAVHCGFTRPVTLHGPRVAKSPTKAELRSCHKRLSALLRHLHRKTFELQAQALKYDRTDPAVEWRNWSKSWRGRWHALHHRCRLGELAGTGSVAVDRMRAIHDALAELQLSYNDVVNRFVERYADRLRELRDDLAAVRTLIDRRTRKKRSEVLPKSGEHTAKGATRPRSTE